jgi:hypothetical protein
MKNKKWIGILATTFLVVLTIITYVYFFDTKISFEENVDIENAPSGEHLSELIKEEEKPEKNLSKAIGITEDLKQTVELEKAETSKGKIEIEMPTIEITPRKQESEEILPQKEAITILQEASANLIENAPLNFQGISGGGQSFYKTTGVTNFSNKVHMVMYGHQFDIRWFEVNETADKPLEEMIPSDSMEYLGGFDRFAAYQETRYKKALYGEYYRSENKLFTRVLKIPEGVSSSSENIKIWNERTLNKENIPASLSNVISSYLIGLEEILSSADTNSIEAIQVSDGFEIIFTVPVDAIKNIEGVHQFRESDDKEPDDMQITARISSDKKIKSMKIKYIPNENNPYYRTNEAHYFAFHKPENHIEFNEPIAGEEDEFTLGNYRFIDTKPPHVKVNTKKIPKELPPLEGEEPVDDEPSFERCADMGIDFRHDHRKWAIACL